MRPSDSEKQSRFLSAEGFDFFSSVSNEQAGRALVVESPHPAAAGSRVKPVAASRYFGG